MKLVYISHPYTGEETKNRREAEQIAAGLTQMHPGILFVNPLNAMRHHKKAKTEYEEVLAQCLALLAKCDGVVMTGKWKDSRGCRREREYAKEKQIPVWDSVEDFGRDEVMPNDCFGTHPCCASCACGKCAERLSCWNCNECTRTDGKRYPVGYTRMGEWDAECVRYRKGGSKH